MSDLIGPHLAHLRAAGMSPQTIRGRERVLRCLAQQLPHGLDLASTEELELWLGHEGWAPKTRETYWSHMVGFYRWATGGHTQRLDWNPAEDIRRPRAPGGLPRPVTDAQLRHALDELDRPWYRAVLLAAAVGMRASEVARADREDVTEERVLILGKGGKTRSVPTDPMVWAEVRDDSGPLFLYRGHQLDGDTLSERTSRMLTKIGLADVTLHRFRHWFGTVVQREYRDLRVTQELMGHASPATTAGYAALTDGQRRTAVAALSDVLSSALRAEHQPDCGRLVPTAALNAPA